MSVNITHGRHLVAFVKLGHATAGVYMCVLLRKQSARSDIGLK
jgi:hypothetical protein